MPSDYCNILDVCRFLERHFATAPEEYGMTGEFATADRGEPALAPRVKPSHLFRGQTKEYQTLRPTIYRDYSPLATWQEMQTLQFEGESLRMPNPHYSAALERDYYFSCVKGWELIWDVERLYPNFPDAVDGHALCQHYGLRTHCLDFSLNVWVSGFFASHSYREGAFEPVADGIGVLYVLDTSEVPPKNLYEIGVQPPPRPYAQKGWLLLVPPEINLLAHPALWKIYFRHSAEASSEVGDRFRQGQDLVLHDDVSRYIESRLAERWVTAGAVRQYVQKVPPHYQPILERSIRELFSGHIPILGEA